jgi:CRISPR/Cas system-associated exonuclease Cas4 (RecB family)
LETLEQIEQGKIQPTEIINIQEKIIEAWYKQTLQKRSGIHVSDLIHCRRQSAFKVLDPEVSTPNLAGIKNMLVGEAVHRQIQKMLGTDEYDHECSIAWTSKTGIIVKATPDIVHKKSGIIIEMKTTSSVKVLREPYDSHLTQLKIYMAITGAPVGKLFYILLGTTTGDNHFKEYLVTFKPGERQRILKRLEKGAEELHRGVTRKNPALVEHVADDPSYFNSLGYNWMCKSCKYQSSCLEMRVEELKKNRKNADLVN